MRNVHRWLTLPFILLLLSVAITGTILQFQQFFGEEEANRERLASVQSHYRLDDPSNDYYNYLERALAVASTLAPGRSINSFEVQLQDADPIITFHLDGTPARKIVINAKSAQIIKDEPDIRESFILRLHTGEVFGDGGLVIGMIWGLALITLCITGGWMYWQMYRARSKRHGWKKIIW